MSRFEASFELFDRPIPGQGLMSDPDNPPPWRTPPTYSNADEAYRYVMQKITLPEHLPDVLQLFRDDVSISMFTRNILMGMFIKGHITHVMILKLAQPVMQSLYVLCLQAGIDPKISHVKTGKQKQQAQVEALRLAEELESAKADEIIPSEQETELVEEESVEEVPTSLLGVR